MRKTSVQRSAGAGFSGEKGPGLVNHVDALSAAQVEPSLFLNLRHSLASREASVSGVDGPFWRLPERVPLRETPESSSVLGDRKTMNIARLHGPALAGSVMIALLVGFAFYVLLIGIFERAAALISLALFLTMAAITWTRPDSESNTKGP